MDHGKGINMKSGIIYMATNKMNGKSYIGQTTKKMEERRTEHKLSKKYYHTKFYDALEKFGWENFEWKVLYETSEEMLDLAEILSIYTYNTFYEGYNSTLGGSGNIRPNDHKNILKRGRSKFIRMPQPMVLELNNLSKKYNTNKQVLLNAGIVMMRDIMAQNANSINMRCNDGTVINIPVPLVFDKGDK